MFNCSCCGTEVTSPYFFNGGVYGYTCIKKVNPNAKKNKPKLKCVEVEVIKVKFDNDNSSRGEAFISVAGDKSVVTAYRAYNDGAFSDFLEIGNFKFFNDKWYTVM